MSRVALVAVLTLCAGIAVAAASAAEGENRLAGSNSPYLLLHADNPVDWYPWGEEALARARREDKPIFVSVGYSTCYWCHVAEREIYSNPEIAALMNEWTVNVKVDREQRPDVDGIYMVATQILTGRGGWPNNVFLTPELKPFYAGSLIIGARLQPGALAEEKTARLSLQACTEKICLPPAKVEVPITLDRASESAEAD